MLLTPARPLDVSPAAQGGHVSGLPTRAGPYAGRELPLSAQERLYYQRFGGEVAKRAYDIGQTADADDVTHAVLRVRTAAPLRHLHGPDRCLLGAGHEVTRIGVRRAPIPTVVYRSRAPDGRVFRVEASFASDAGRTATGVSEVFWRWLERPDVAWNLIERITPWERCERAPGRCAAFDRHLFDALDLPIHQLATQEGRSR